MIDSGHGRWEISLVLPHRLDADPICQLLTQASICRYFDRSILPQKHEQPPTYHQLRTVPFICGVCRRVKALPFELRDQTCLGRTDPYINKPQPPPIHQHQPLVHLLRIVCLSCPFADSFECVRLSESLIGLSLSYLQQSKRR